MFKLCHVFLTVVLISLYGCSNDNSANNDATQDASADAAVASKVSESTATEQIFRSNGAVQCEGGGDDLATTAKMLEEAGIAVIDSKCGYMTGRMMPALCGSPTSNINIHTIKQEDLAKSKELGFWPVIALIDQAKGQGFEVAETCDSDSKEG
ncbi:hypothetical protein [Agarilytica rhodophyticola]|uniref:hypothetical protein n=1 Tax=Agarilytica rhodophyticola TaxID=1737490 RepID=UPI000B347B2F|nr:hypothetical protein [Agarilytica rhodophyticola]